MSIVNRWILMAAKQLMWFMTTSTITCPGRRFAETTRQQEPCTAQHDRTLKVSLKQRHPKNERPLKRQTTNRHLTKDCCMTLRLDILSKWYACLLMSVCICEFSITQWGCLHGLLYRAANCCGSVKTELLCYLSIFLIIPVWH